MENKHNCKYCNYGTDRLSSYNKHIKTNKHRLNIKILAKSQSSKNEGATSKNEERSSKNEGEISKNIKMTCEFCSKLILKSNKVRHYNACKSKEKIIRIELEKKLAKLEKEKNMLATEKEEMQKDFNEFMKNVIKQGVGNTVVQHNDNRKINYYYVVSNFQDAYNYDDLMNPPLTVDELNLIKQSPQHT